MRLPTNKNRVMINGRNGSGKTQAAVWLLSQANFTTAPFIVLNQKCTAIIDAIPGAHHVDNKFRPKKPGIYIYHHIPDKDDDDLEDLLWYVWSKGGMGVYLDEGYMINPRSPALNALYTQGREKKIPMITLSQRPTMLSRFAISESNFFMLFHMVDKKDRERVQGYIPTQLEPLMHSEAGTARALPEFHSLYYDVDKNTLEILLPVPDEETIMQIFHDRQNLSKKRNVLI
jgi:hypothetical protein